MNKRGASLDNLWSVVYFFGIAISFIVIIMFWNVVHSEASDLFTGSSIGTDIDNNTERAVGHFDLILVIGWIGLHIGILITAFLLRTHPVMYVVALFIMALLVMIAVPLSNAWNELSADEDVIMTGAIAEMPKVDFIMDNLPKFELVWGFATAIVMFAMARSEGII